MNTPRGLLGPVFAMARPGRPPAEASALIAAATMFKRSSIAATAAEIARRVAEDCVAYVDSDREEEIIAALSQLEAHMKPAPIVALSRSADIDTAALVVAARTKRFHARSCRQLSEPEWKRETAEVVSQLTERLAARYRRILKESW